MVNDIHIFPANKAQIYMSNLPNVTKATVEGSTHLLDFVASKMQGWRPGMEDYYIAEPNFSPDLSLFGVFDGHGGHQIAELVAAHFVEFLRYSLGRTNDREQALKEAFSSMDNSVREYVDSGGIRASDSRVWGCTGLVVLIDDLNIYVANAGDCRCLIVRGNQAIQWSTEHKPELKTEKDRITRAGFTVNHNRIDGTINVSRSFGDFAFKSNRQFPPEKQAVISVPDVSPHKREANDEYLLLVSDGIWEAMSNERIAGYSKESDELVGLKAAAERLLEECLSPNPSSHPRGADNLTAILVKFKKQR